MMTLRTITLRDYFVAAIDTFGSCKSAFNKNRIMIYKFADIGNGIAVRLISDNISFYEDRNKNDEQSTAETEQKFFSDCCFLPF